MVNATWHEWPTNFSNGTSIDGIGNYVKYMNNVTGGFFSSAVIVIIFVMVFFVGIAMGTKRALASACFISFVFSVYFWRISLISPVIVISLLMATILFTIGTKSEERY